jgi:hypothetical protein
MEGVDGGIVGQIVPGSDGWLRFAKPVEMVKPIE